MSNRYMKHFLRQYLASQNEAPWVGEIRQKLDLVIQTLGDIMATQADIAAALAKVQDDVAAQTTVEQSVVTFIQGLQTQIAAIGSSTTDTTTAAALTALSATIEGNTAGLSSAIAANTAAPAAPAPVVPPAV